jgi:hypothetical protein
MGGMRCRVLLCQSHCCIYTLIYYLTCPCTFPGAQVKPNYPGRSSHVSFNSAGQGTIIFNRGCGFNLIKDELGSTANTSHHRSVMQDLLSPLLSVVAVMGVCLLSHTCTMGRHWDIRPACLTWCIIITPQALGESSRRSTIVGI